MHDLIEKILCTDTYTKRSDMSVTDINRGTKEIILADRYHKDIKNYIRSNKIEMNKRMPSIMGKAWDMYITALCEDDPDYMVHTCVAMYFTLNDKTYVISGEIDLYHKPSQTLIDNKLVPMDKLIKLSMSNKDYERQLNGYRWLLAKGFDMKTKEQYNMHIDNLALVVGLRDYTPYMDRFDSINVMKIPCYDMQQVENMFIDKLIEIIEYSELSDDEIPPCSADERWEKKTTYPIFKKDSKSDARAMPKTSQISSYDEAEQFIKNHKDKDKLEIRIRKGGSTKCMNNCIVGKLGKCNYYNQFIKGL